MRKTTRKKKEFFAILVYFFIFLLTAFACLFYFRNAFFQRQYFISPLATPFFQNKYQNTKTENLQKLKDILKEKKISFSSVSITPDSFYLVRLKNNSEILFSNSKDFLQQVSSLQLIVSRLTIEGKEFSRLDLRFDNPVVVFK